MIELILLAVAFLIGVLAYFVNWKDRWRAITWRMFPRCEHCKRLFKIAFEGSCTAYNTSYYDEKTKEWKQKDLKPWEDPNRDRLLCRCCAEEHYQYWQDMWIEYRNNVM
jgi:hypothetical protein